MSGLIKVAVVVALLAGALVWLASRAGEQPLTRQETPVTLDASAK